MSGLYAAGFDQNHNNQNQNQFNQKGFQNQNQQPQDYFKFQNVSPEMLNYGLNAGQAMFKTQQDKWMPGVSGFWITLKQYFSVIFFFFKIFQAFKYC
jgi:hypothetical protein